MSPSSEPTSLVVETGQGPARLVVQLPDVPLAGPVRTLVLGHGAGGGFSGKDLRAASRAALDAGWRVVLFEQPWLVAGRRVAVAPPRLDAAWRAGLGELASHDGLVGPLVLGGRSAGARVACRTASDLGAAAVIALAFPLHPPGRADDPTRSRAGELALPGCPLLVVQGRRDPFGTAAQVRTALDLPRVRATAQVVELDGDHGLSADPDGVRGAVHRFLTELAG